MNVFMFYISLIWIDGYCDLSSDKSKLLAINIDNKDYLCAMAINNCFNGINDILIVLSI